MPSLLHFPCEEINWILQVLDFIIPKLAVIKRESPNRRATIHSPKNLPKFGAHAVKELLKK